MDRNKKEGKAAVKGNEEEENKEQREEISESCSSIGVNIDEGKMGIDEEGDGGSSEVQSSAFGSLSSLQNLLPMNEEGIATSTATAVADSDEFLRETRLGNNETSSSSSSVPCLRVEDSSNRVFWVRKVRPNDLNPYKRMLFLDKAFALKIKSLILPGENIEKGVVGIITDHQQSRKFTITFKSYNRRYMLISGWGNFRKNSNWLKVGMKIKISAFRDSESQDLWFIVVPEETESRE